LVCRKFFTVFDVEGSRVGFAEPNEECVRPWLPDTTPILTGLRVCPRSFYLLNQCASAGELKYVKEWKPDPKYKPPPPEPPAKPCVPPKGLKSKPKVALLLMRFSPPGH
jgi:hypothetical protein